MKNLVIIAVAYAVLAQPVLAEKLPLAAISKYFNEITTAQTEFTQLNDDGTASSGTITIRRPGRVRFEYAAPSESLVLASGGQVAVFDAKSNEPPQRFPLNKTPLSLILARNIDLSNAKMVVGHTAEGDATIVTAQDPKRPENGQIKLVFSADPVALRQWVVFDGAGQQTTILLGEFRMGESFRHRFFDIRREMSARGFKEPDQN